MEFTREQIENWKAYERVRESGVINMLDLIRGSRLANISKEDYRFTLMNYSALREAAQCQK